MTFSTFIAKRYFFSKSKWNIVNIVSNSALFVLIVAVCSFFIVLSVFSGLKSFGSNYSNAFDPDIKITSLNSKHFDYVLIADKISPVSNISAISSQLEEKVLVKNDDITSFAMLKGIQRNFSSIFDIEKMVSAGGWLNGSDIRNRSVVSSFLADELKLGLYNYGGGIMLLVPKTQKTSSIFKQPFNRSVNMVVGVFNSNDFDDKKSIFIPLSNAQNLLALSKNQVSSISIKTIDSDKKLDTSKELQKLLGQNFSVKTREEINETYYKMLNSEEIIINLVLALILVVAMFNVVGAIIILITEKQKNVLTLFKIGATRKQIQFSFFKHGVYLTFFGGFFGLIIGFIFVYLQQAYGIFKLSGTSIPYPVLIEFKNFFIVLFWVVTIGVISAYLSLFSLKKIKL